jgi:hypothetical protein
VVNKAFVKAGADAASDGWVKMRSANGWPHPDLREADLWEGLGDAEVLRSGPRPLSRPPT